MTMEKRNYDVSLSEVEQTSDGLFVRGIVNRPGSWSQPLTARNGKTFIERIMPNVFTKAIQRSKNIEFLAEHDKEKLLANTQSGTLKLEETPNGLVMEARIAPTSYGKDFHVLINEKLIPAMSFGMQVLKDEWTTENGINKRSIKDLALFEVSAVRNPAYTDSAIQARSHEAVVDVDVPEIEERDYKTMNLKELRERKQELLKQAKQVLDGAKQENRSLEADEVLQQEILSEDIRSIREQIESLEKATKPKGEINKMTNFDLETEKRAVTAFIRKQDNEELRSLTTGADPGKMTIPTNISNEIIEKLMEYAPLFSRTRNFTPVNGFLQILRESTFGSASFVAEGGNVVLSDFAMDKVTLDQKRIATGIELSNQLINDSGIDVLGYATKVLTKRLGLAMDTSILLGDKATQFEGILVDPGTTISTVTTAGVQAIAIDDLLELYNQMHPEYQSGAVWVMSRVTFNLISKLKDTQGHYLLVKDVAETGVTYKLFGSAIIINDAMPPALTGNKAIVFANFNEGYATMTKKGMELKIVNGDTPNVLKGTHTLVLDTYADGKFLNQDAIKILKIK